jgi:hypothetical protein
MELEEIRFAPGAFLCDSPKMSSRRFHSFLGSVLGAWLGVEAFGQDWPQLLGPTGDAVYTGPVLAEEWPQEGPPFGLEIAGGGRVFKSDRG